MANKVVIFIENKSVDTSNNFSLAKLLLSMLDLWIEKPEKVKTWKKWLNLTCRLSCFAIMLISLANIFIYKNKLLENSQYLFIIIQQVSSLHNMKIFCSSKIQLCSLISKAFTSLQVPHLLNSEFQQFESRCRKSPKGTIMVIFIVTFQVCLLWIFSRLNVKFFPSNETTVYLELAIVANMLPASFLNMGFMFFYTTMLSLIICLIDHLDDVFRNLHETTHLLNSRNEQLNAAEIINLKVKVILKYAHQIHVKVIDVIDGVNLMFANAMLMQAIVVLLAQCIFAFQLAADSNINTELKLALLQSILLVTFVFGKMAYLASQISYKFSRLKDTCCGAAWWAWNNENQSSVKIMVARFSVPSQLKIGPFYVFSLTFFAALMQISITYLIFLMGVNSGSVVTTKV